MNSGRQEAAPPKEITMIRLFFFISGVSLLAIGPFSYKPQPIIFAHAKHEQVMPVELSLSHDQLGALIQR